MKAERARLQRLRRLERVRDIAKQNAAMAAAEAESTLAQLTLLAERTQRLAGEYAARREAPDGAALRQLGNFSAGLQGIARTTSGDVDRARSIADRKLADLGTAERRRAVVEERIADKVREIQRRGEGVALTGRKQLGTDLD